MLTTIAYIIAFVVALEHLFIMSLEMFYSSNEVAQRTFALDRDFLQDYRVKTLFKNQGLYNGFLAVGIIWGMFFAPRAAQFPLVMFFVICIVIAAIYGSIDFSKIHIMEAGISSIHYIDFVNFVISDWIVIKNYG